VGVPIRNTADYSPFGVQLDGRTIQGDFYRFGYQGSEKDDESKGGGNSYTTFFRQLDPRVGRWFSVDPLFEEIEDEAPYNSMGNSPIQFNDPEGDCPWCPVFIAIAILAPSEFSDGPTEQNPGGYYGGGAQGQNVFEGAKQLLFAAIPAPKTTPGGPMLSAKKPITAKPSLTKSKSQPTNSSQVSQKSAKSQSATSKSKNTSNSKSGVKQVLSNPDAKKVAESMDWTPVSPGNVPSKIIKQTEKNPVYFSEKTNRYYSPDKAGHRADNAWKSFDKDGGRVTVTTNTNTKSVSIVSN
jgi:RHS repeat-associated protein